MSEPCVTNVIVGNSPELAAALTCFLVLVLQYYSASHDQQLKKKLYFWFLKQCFPLERNKLFNNVWMNGFK